MGEEEEERERERGRETGNEDGMRERERHRREKIEEKSWCSFSRERNETERQDNRHSDCKSHITKSRHQHVKRPKNDRFLGLKYLAHFFLL
jgi:predicted oxidoreductase